MIYENLEIRYAGTTYQVWVEIESGMFEVRNGLPIKFHLIDYSEDVPYDMNEMASYLNDNHRSELYDLITGDYDYLIGQDPQTTCEYVSVKELRI